MVDKMEILKVGGIVVFSVMLALLMAFSIEVNATTISSCQNLNSQGFYELNQSISTSGTCMQITNDNITLDCNGFSISSDNTGTGIDVFLSNNISIYNCDINNFDDGLSLDSVFDVKILNSHFNNNFDNCFVASNFHDYVYIGNSTFNYCGDDGLNIQYFTNSIFKEIEVIGNFDFGVALTGLNWNTSFNDVLISGNGDDGIRINDCENCSILNSVIYSNIDRNIGLTGCDNFIINNTEIYHGIGNYEIISVTSDNTIFDNINFINSTASTGILFSSCNNVLMNNLNFITGINSRGIYFYNSNGLVKNSVIKSDNSQLSDLGIRCLQSICYVRNTNIESDDISLISDNSFLQVNDSISNTVIQSSNSGITELYNVSNNNIYFSDYGSSILRFWNLTIINPNNSTFILNDKQSKSILNLTQNFTTFYIAEFNHTNNISVQLTPHTINSNKDGFFPSQSSVLMNQDRIITLSLLAIPKTLTGSFCYTGNILAVVDGQETCNSTGCSWNNVTVYHDCPNGCENNLSVRGSECVQPEILIYPLGVIIIIICFVILGWLAKD